jgi:Na+/melibiose symporter-like transporter
MMSDVVDYEKHLSGRSLGGVVFSTNLFSIKFGVALGGAMLGWLLAFGGYVGGAEVQSGSALTMINALYTLIPGAIFITVAAMVNFYPLTEKRVKEVKESLN